MVKITKNIFFNKEFVKIFEIILIVFGIFMLYQIIRKILGGSWTIEEIILGIVLLNIGATFTIGIMLAQVKSDHGHLKKQFNSLAGDFKAHVKK